MTSKISGFLRHWLAPVILLFAMGLQCVYFAAVNGQTSDEPFYHAVGYPIAAKNSYRIQGEHPPLISALGAVAMLPLKPVFPFENPILLENSSEVDVSKTGLKFLYEMGNDADQLIFRSRLPVIFLTLLLGLVIYLWSFRLWGAAGAITSLALFAFCPNMIAHGSLFTTDQGIAVFFTISLFFLSQYLEQGKLKHLIFAGIAAGWTVMSKMSGIIIIPAAASLFLVHPFLVKTPLAPKWNSTAERWYAALALFLLIFSFSHKITTAFIAPLVAYALYPAVSARFTKKAGVIVVASAFVASLISLWLLKKKVPSIAAGLLAWNVGIALFFALPRLFRNPSQIQWLLKSFTLMSFTALATIVFTYTDFLTNLIRFKPFIHFIRSLLTAVMHTHSDHKMCVGSLITCDERYFAGLLLIKTPVAVLGLFGAAILLMPFLKKSAFQKAAAFLPGAVFLLIGSLANSINIGLRHVMPVYPFLFLTAGAAAAWIAQLRSPMLRPVIFVLLSAALLWNASANLRYLPNSLSYFNEFIGSPEKGAELVTDSNINWGQDNRRLVAWIREHNIPSVKIWTRFMNEQAFRYYGIPWSPWKELDWKSPEPGYYAMDLEAYLSHRNDPSSWISKTPVYSRAGINFIILKIGEVA